MGLFERRVPQNVTVYHQFSDSIATLKGVPHAQAHPNHIVECASQHIPKTIRLSWLHILLKPLAGINKPSAKWCSRSYKSADKDRPTSSYHKQ